jgi:hypothetical protein
MPYRDEPALHDPLFASIRIATPCDASSEAMAGDDRVRHCGLCERKVYDFAQLTRAEIVTLLQDHGELPCARLHRRADGTLITADCARGVRRRTRRLAVVAVACAAGAALAAGAAAPAESPSTRADATPQQEVYSVVGRVSLPSTQARFDPDAFLRPQTHEPADAQTLGAMTCALRIDRDALDDAMRPLIEEGTASDEAPTSPRSPNSASRSSKSNTPPIASHAALARGSSSLMRWRTRAQPSARKAPTTMYSGINGERIAGSWRLRSCARDAMPVRGSEKRPCGSSCRSSSRS